MKRFELLLVSVLLTSPRLHQHSSDAQIEVGVYLLQLSATHRQVESIVFHSLVRFNTEVNPTLSHGVGNDDTLVTLS